MAEGRADRLADPDYSRFDPRNPRNYKVYIVKPGDTLSGIARFRKGLTVADLEWLNRISAGAPLHIGQNVKVPRSDEHTSELQSLMRISYAVFCLQKKTRLQYICTSTTTT